MDDWREKARDRRAKLMDKFFVWLLVMATIGILFVFYETHREHTGQLREATCKIMMNKKMHTI